MSSRLIAVAAVLLLSFAATEGVSCISDRDSFTWLNVDVSPNVTLQHAFSPRQPQARRHWLFTGADSDVSMRVSERYVLWLYGDSLLGNWTGMGGAKQRRRTCSASPYGCRMPHSTVGMFDSVESRMNWFWGANGTSFLSADWATNASIFWGTALTPVVGDRICVVGVRVELSNSPGPFSFYTNGSYVCCLDGVSTNPTDPLSWKQTWARIPQSGVPAEAVNASSAWSVEWNACCLAVPVAEYNNESTVHLFGVLTPPTYGTISTQLSRQVLVRLRLQTLVSLEWTEGDFQVWAVNLSWVSLGNLSAPFLADSSAALWSPAVPEFTVGYSASLAVYNASYFVASIPFLATYIEFRFAASPQGPWSLPVPVYSLPKPFNDTTLYFCYAVKFHPELNWLVAPSDKEAVHVFTYVCNSFRVDVLYDNGNETIYTPQFLNVAFRPSEP